MKGNLKYWLLALAYFGIFVAASMFRQQPIDWTPSFSKEKKMPFASRLVFELLKNQFAQNISSNRKPFFHLLPDVKEEKSTLILVQQDLQLDRFDLNALIDFANRGNDVFIAAEKFSENILDTLGLEQSEQYHLTNITTDNKRFTSANLVNPVFSETGKISLRSNYRVTKLSFKDSVFLNKHKILGIYSPKEVEQDYTDINFVKIDVGTGHFYVHSFPYAFTNYQVVHEENHRYIAACFSYLNRQNIIWDEYYKFGSTSARTPIRVLLANPALKWAYFVAIIAFLLFLIFEAKRKQPVIPIIKPYENSSLVFTKTIGSLYYHKADHKDLATKQITYFLAKVREELNILEKPSDPNFEEKILKKTGFEEQFITEFVHYLNWVNKQSKLTAENLKKLNILIEKFNEHGRK